MKYTRLGHTDLEVNRICLGPMTWGQQNSGVEGHAQLDCAVAAGINFIDTAEMYPFPPRAETYGQTEIIIGNTGIAEYVALAYVNSRPFLTSYITGATTNLTQLQANIASVEVELPKVVVKGIEKIHTRYPNPCP